MGYTIPGWLDEVLDFIGINFPNVDEDDYREMADAMREFAEKFEGHGGDAHKAFSRLLSSSEGWAVDAMEKHWAKVKGSHLEKLPELARLFADACDGLAVIIEGMKRKAEAELAIMAGSVGLSIGLAWVTGGLSAVLGAAEIAAMRQAVKRILDEAVERIVDEVIAKLTEPVNAKLEAMVEDMVLDLAEGAFSIPPADGSSGGGAGHGKDGHGGMQLASAGGNSEGSGGPQKATKIDHIEFEDGAGKVSRHGGDLKTAASDPLGRARGAFGRSKGRDPFTQAFDSVLHGALKGTDKALTKIAKHVTETVPDRVKATSRIHKGTDHDVRNRVDAIDAGKQGDGKSGGPGVDDGRGKSLQDKLKLASSELSQRARSLQNKETCGDPIDMANGQMILAQTDVALPGVLPLILCRTHLSGFDRGRSFGPSWACTLDERLEQDEALGGFWWHREDGSALAYPRLPDLPGDRVGPAAGERLPLTYVTRDSSYVLTVQDPYTGLTRHFEAAAARDDMWWLVGIEDRNGNTVTVERDEHDVPLSVTHSGGYRVLVGSDAEQGRVTTLSVLDDGRPVTLRTFRYDEAGDLVEICNAVGAATRFGYDGVHRVTGWRDSNDTAFDYAYDAGGRVVETRGTDGILNSLISYGDVEPDGTSTVTYTDSLGHATVYRANHHGQVIAITDPLGHTTTQQWDSQDRLMSHTDPLGRTTRWERDADGNVTALTAPDGTVTRLDYDALRMPVSIIAPDGAVTHQEYDERGNRTAVVGPDGAVHRFTHDATGALESITDPLGTTLRMSHDAAGLPVSVQDARGARTVCRRDAFGQPVELTDALGRTSRMAWDAEGRLRTRTAPDGSHEAWEWDGEGNCVRHTDQLGGVTASAFGPFDLLSARTTPDGSTHTFVHDTEQRLTQVVNPAGLAWTYTFDAVGRVLTETDFDGRTSRCAYDAAGHLTTRTNAAGQTVGYEFDANGRLAAKTVGDTRTSFSYDAASRLTAAQSPQCGLEFTYDVAGHLLTQTVDGATLRLAYDLAGRRISRTTPTGALTELGWDPVGNRTALTVDGRHALAFGHDLLGRETERTVDGTLSLTSDWDAGDRLSGQNLTVGPGRRIRARSYTYRADSHLTGVHEAVTGRGTTYTLDPIGRPLDAAGPAGPENYAYDASGNQVTAHWPDRAADPGARGERDYTGTRVTRAGHTHYRYDDAGRLLERVKKRLSRKPDVWRYSWDAEDRLTSCTTPDGATWHYRYDPLGRRTAKYRLDNAGSVLDETLFTWDGTRLTEQVDTATGTTLTWDHDGFRPLVQYERKRLSDDEVDTRFFAIVSDLVGTPTELVDENGTIAWRSRTTVWGTTAVNPDAAAHTPLRYPGQYTDPETGLHYNYFRHYDPETARYVSPDPLGLMPAPNPVAYVSNPLDLYDPVGLAPCRKDHYEWTQGSNGHGGSIRYRPLDHLGRPTGVSACIRPEMLRSGTPAGKVTPPGWRGHGTAFNEARGHLLADRLGGAGVRHNAKHNLVTQTQDPYNSPYQRDMIEGEIFKVVDRGEVVQYDIKPIYEGTNPIPIRLEYSAYGNQGFELTGWLDNPAAGVRTAIPGWKP
ncbi:RHS repeat-associated core domain-containing protein [Streptomyces sp. NPDC058695]|uniref:RHS repeat-associated core domain-containing protein n=1 Tax=Streptomyces sp. NPDC058695 TaxID=3346604 RepID=UPI003657FCA6